MGLSFVRYLLPFLLVLPISGTEDFGNNGTIPETHEPKINRRIVRLYSGTRPKPIVCSGEGFQADPTDCTIFHRCMKNGNGKYISFKFQCGPGTIYDPESEICNHPERTKRTNCGGNVPMPIHVPNIEFTSDNDISKEIPSPITTKDPMRAHKATTLSFSSLHTTHHGDVSSLATKYPWASTSHQYTEPTSNPWASSTEWQDSRTTKTLPTKRRVNESFSTSITPPWMSSQNVHSTTPRMINRQTTQFGELCTSEGFMGDSENCRKFYRCINNQRGGFIKYEFMCNEPTIWDDDKQSCNHAWDVKRRRCGRGSLIDTNEVSTTRKQVNAYSTESLSSAKPSPSQSQLQINYGSKVTQTQTQISSGSVPQNQTQINYGYGVANDSINLSILQNQTQVSHGAAISQAQTQINYGDKAIQTQLQIDHSKESSQAQSQISESTSTSRSTSYHESQSMTGTNSNKECTESGFMGDSNDCKKFYRCVDNGRGGFIRYEFSCGEGTVWDPKLEACNHAWAVQECGGKAPSESATPSTVKTTESSTKPTISSSTFMTSKTTVTQGYYSSTEEATDEDNDIPYGNQPAISVPSKPPQQETTSKAPQISSNNNCKSSGFMGDNSDCKKFYRCVDNGNGGYTRYEFSCGEGTVWDQKIEACNHAWAVENCGGTVTTGNPTSTQTSTMSLISMIPSQIDDNDVGYGSQFDEQISSSASFTTTTEKLLTTTIQSTQSSGSSMGSRSDCTSNGFMGDDNDCKKFYRCVDNGNGGYTRYEFSCGEGTVWDPKIQACNHAWAVEKCGSNSVQDINKVETTTRKDIGSTTVISSSMSVQQTDDDNDIGYGQQNKEPQATPQPTTSRPQYLDSDSNECKSSGFMGDKNDCKKFYRCVDNGDGTYLRYEFSCGEGTVWDSRIDVCNHAWAVENCGGINSQPTSKPNPINNYEDENVGGYPVQGEHPTQSTPTTNSLSSSTTSMEVSNTDNNCKSSGFMGDRMDCKRFYRCVDNGQGGYTRYEFSCGEGTVWDQSIEACNHDWAVKSHCSQSGNIESNNGHSTSQSLYVDPETEPSESSQHTTQKTSTSRTTIKPSGNRCTQEGFYGDENNCRNFYRCVDNGQGGYIKYEFSCGEGTVWNQDIQACDHESPDKKCIANSLGSTSIRPSTKYDEMLSETTNKPPSSTTESESYYTSQKPQFSSDKCENEGFYGDSNNCKKFYRCVDNGQGSFTKYEFTCGDGTVWDQEILACNHETSDKQCAAYLENTSSTTTSSFEVESSTHSQEQHTTHHSETTSSNSGKDKCEMDGFFANSNDCKKFYRCVSNGNGGFTKYDFSCGEGTVWVQEIQACDFDNDISSCSNKVDSSTTPPPNQEPQSTTTVASTSTNQYTTQSPPPSKEDDEYPSASSSKPPEGNGNCQSEGFFGNKKDCTRFYRCVDNGQGGYTKYDFTCGEGTAWDANIQTCNHISEVEGCQNVNEQQSQSKPINDEQSSQSTENTSTTKSSTSTESSKPSKTDKCDQEGYFGNTNDCTMFYRCVDNGKGGFTKYDFTCGEGTVWDQDLTTCNHPQNVVNPSCTNSDKPQSSSEGPSSTESSGTTASSSGQSSESANDNNNPNSSNSSQESSSKKPANQKVKCDKAGFYPDPDDCKKFYRCVDWDGNGEKFSVYHFDCGEGTIWDPQLETCNHEDSVYPPRDCSGTQSQNENVTQETTTTEGSTTTQSITEESTTTQQSSSSEQTTQQSSTTEKATTSTEKTTSQQTTQQSTTESTTTQQSTTESTTTQQTTTSEKTTQSTTEQTTTEPTKTTQEQTTQESTTSQQTTTQQSTSSEQTTTQQSTTSEETTTQQSTTGEQTTTQGSTTSEQTTTQQSTTSVQTTTQQSSTSEQTTQQSSNTTDSTTESTTTEQTTTTTEQSSTEQSTTENTTEQQSSTTESSTTSTESNESTTTESSQSSSDKECPETDDDQYLYVCPTSFKRHPKYCNMFYQCTEDDESHEVKIATFKCPNNTIYDESKTQCVEEDKADKKCNGQIARKYRVKRLNINYKEPIEASRNKHTCYSAGNYPFEENNECSGGFLKCQQMKTGKLRGYVHRCPEGYTFWSISKRCEKKEIMKGCKESANIWKERWEIPVEKKNIAK